MTQYLALTYTADVDWFAPEQADVLAGSSLWRIPTASWPAPCCTRPAPSPSSG